MGISRTPRWNARNGGHELGSNHPLRAALISNYLIKICLRRGAPYAPFDVFFYLLARPPKPEKRRRGVFKGSKVGTDSPALGTVHSKRNLANVPLPKYVLNLWFITAQIITIGLVNSPLSNAFNTKPLLWSSTRLFIPPTFIGLMIDANWTPPVLSS